MPLYRREGRREREREREGGRERECLANNLHLVEGGDSSGTKKTFELNVQYYADIEHGSLFVTHVSRCWKRSGKKGS